MSRRSSVIITHRIPTPNGGVSPNAYIPEITVDIRAFWPPLVTDQELLIAFEEAVSRARRAMKEKRAPA